MSTWKTADGRTLACPDIDDRHLWNIVRLQVRRIRETVKLHTGPAEDLNEWLRLRLSVWDDVHDANELRAFRRHARRDMRKSVAAMRGALSHAIDELARRNLLPTAEELHVAWDRVCGGDGGPDLSDDPKMRPWCLVELWVGFRGVPTFTPEWLAEQQAITASRSLDASTSAP